MPGITEIVFVSVAVLLFLSVVASKISDRFGVPALLLFLLIGMLAGSEGIGGIYFDDPNIAQAVGMLALVIILFSGGLDTNWESVRGVMKESLILATLGVLVTAIILGYAAKLVFDIPILMGMLLASITSSTDAAAVFALLRSKGVRLKGRLQPLLEFESGSNDPMAVFLTVGLIEIISASETSIFNLILFLIGQMVIGGLVGIVMGKVALYLINRLKLGYDGLYPVLVLALIMLTFGVTNLIGGSGILAVYLVGLSLGRAEFLHKRSVLRFYDGMAWLMQIIMFLTLGLLVFPSQLITIAVPGLILSVVLMLIARPISVWLCLLPFPMPWREKTFISWVGLRGSVPVILATYPRVAGLDETGLIFNTIFFVVLTSVLIQGTSIPQVARWLKVDDPDADEGPQYPLELTARHGWRGLLQEVVISPDSPVVGKAIYELGLPREYLIVLISRDDEFLIPNGSIVLEPNDRMLGLARPEAHAKVNEIVSAPIADPLVTSV